jgi:hypothetical protein
MGVKIEMTRAGGLVDEWHNRTYFFFPPAPFVFLLATALVGFSEVSFLFRGTDVLTTGLKKDSSLPWEDLFLANLIFSMAFVTLSWLKPFSFTRNSTRPWRKN